MDIINFFVNLLSDPRGAIAGWIIALGPLWVYSPLFLIVFVETGLVFFPVSYTHLTLPTILRV